ncbi:hypothetical protein CHCC20335_1566 [Bacillus paralicheniformis]|nr:hypothetical protein CHCC20335_1566 [Bacillus paralicheniformis]
METKKPDLFPAFFEKNYWALLFLPHPHPFFFTFFEKVD